MHGSSYPNQGTHASSETILDAIFPDKKPFQKGTLHDSLNVQPCSTRKERSTPDIPIKLEMSLSLSQVDRLSFFREAREALFAKKAQRSLSTVLASVVQGMSTDHELRTHDMGALAGDLGCTARQVKFCVSLLNRWLVALAIEES